jgi:hypothetical protein
MGAIMDQPQKTPKEVFQSFPVVNLGWTQVPDPETVFGYLYLKIKYLKEMYLSARTVYDKYMASLEYEVSRNDDLLHKVKHVNQPKYALSKDRKPDKRYNDLPKTKDALPNHIAKDQRNEIPTVKECVRVRRENADYNRIYRFGKVT